jgi:hypothetical protein
MSAMRPGLPSRLDDVLALALARKPIDRPSRPASILRSLIELSYESSIMATALDVAEALATVIPAKRQTGRGALDDVIRRQLADQSVARRTAVTDGKPPATQTMEVDPTSTGLFRKLDSDGLSRLEGGDDAMISVSRNPVPPPPPGTTGQPYEPSKDPDRRTEVGGPPTGQVPKAELTNPAVKRYQARRRFAGYRAAIWIALAAGMAAAVTWRLTRPPDSVTSAAPIPPPPDPGALAEPRGTLEIDSNPTGAIVTVADRVLGPAPRAAHVASGVKIHIKLDLKGYQLYEDDLSVEAGKTLVLRPKLSAAPALVHVETTPPGAAVTLGDQALGTTPLTKQAAVATGIELAIAKPGYEPVKLKVDLRAGEQTNVARELKELQKFGVVLVAVTGAADWGYVWFRGKNLGQNYTMAGGQTPFKLPVGKQQLEIAHPKAGSKTVTIEVTEHGQTRVTVPL